MKHLLLFVVVVAVCFLTDCTTNVTGGTETGDAVITGALFTTKGKAASGIPVIIRPRTTLADISGIAKQLADTATATTDESGRFSFDTSINAGTYSIEAASGNNAVFIDSVVVRSSGGTVSLPSDTLKPAGAITGVVSLTEGGDPRKVFVLAFGIDRFARVEEDGSFMFEKLAEGAYDLRIISSLDDYGVVDTSGVDVASEGTTDLGTVALPFTGIPVVTGLELEYDTMKQIVTLSWERADTGLVKGYNIYRRDIDSSFGQTPINGTTLVIDTVYTDSTGIQDQTYEYKVVVVDKEDNAGMMSAGNSVKIESAYVLSSTIDSTDGIVITPFGLFVHKGHVFIADGWAKRIWEMDLTGNLVGQFGSEGSDSGKFTSPHDILFDAGGNCWIADFASNKVQKLDSNRIFIASWSWVKNGRGDSIQIVEPTKLAVDDSSNIYILYNSANWQIAIIDSQGILLEHWRVGGNAITGIAIDRQGRVVVRSDSLHVALFNSTGALVRRIPLSGGEPSEITTDRAGLIYIHNSTSGTISTYDANGLFQTRWRVSGDSGGDMVIGPSGEVLFGSLFPGKIQIFIKR